MDKDGTEGKFSAKAKKAGKSTHSYALSVIKQYKGKEGLSVGDARLLKQAVLSENFRKMREKK